MCPGRTRQVSSSRPSREAFAVPDDLPGGRAGEGEALRVEPGLYVFRHRAVEQGLVPEDARLVRVRHEPRARPPEKVGDPGGVVGVRVRDDQIADVGKPVSVRGDLLLDPEVVEIHPGVHQDEPLPRIDQPCVAVERVGQPEAVVARGCEGNAACNLHAPFSLPVKRLLPPVDDPVQLRRSISTSAGGACASRRAAVLEPAARDDAGDRIARLYDALFPQLFCRRQRRRAGGLGKGFPRCAQKPLGLQNFRR